MLVLLGTSSPWLRYRLHHLPRLGLPVALVAAHIPATPEALRHVDAGRECIRYQRLRDDRHR